ncbi:unnamed protein product [Calicophoron daubneyi]|uniref:Calcium homeostasis endoplasmic reticulum protein n=1 Tax=Calicophoron daubneyi TaxID=300641 RepID=A0AAV2TY16_CALDB
MAIPAPPSDLEQRNIIEKLAEFVARNGQEFETLTKDKQRDNPKFAFLQGGEYYDYYTFKVEEARKRWQNQRPAKESYPQNFDYGYQWNNAFPDHPDPSGPRDHYGSGRDFVQRYPPPNQCGWGGSGGSGGPPGNWYPPPPWASFQGGPGMCPGYNRPPPPIDAYQDRPYGMQQQQCGYPGSANQGSYPPPQGFTYPPDGFQDYASSGGYDSQSATNGPAGPQLTEADIEQSEKNLKAQHDVLMVQQEKEIQDLLDKTQSDAISERCSGQNMKVEQMNEVIQPLIEACTKENISKGKTWVIEHTADSKESSDLIADYLLMRAAAHDASFDVRLHLVYLLNDLLHHCKRRGAPSHLQETLQRVVPLVFCLASEIADDDKKAKLNRVLDIWDSNAYLPTSILEEMRPPRMEEFLNDWKDKRTEANQTAIEEIKKRIEAQYSALEQQHRDFTDHVHRQMAAASAAQQDSSGHSQSGSTHSQYDSDQMQHPGGPEYGMWSSQGFHPPPYEVGGGDSDMLEPPHRMPPGGAGGGFFMPPRFQPPHNAGPGYLPPCGGWGGDPRGPPPNWMPPMRPPPQRLSGYREGYGMPGGGMREPMDDFYIEGEDDHEDRGGYDRAYDRSGYDDQYDDYHRHNDRMRDSHEERTHHYRSGRPSRFSSASSRHDGPSREGSAGSRSRQTEEETKASSPAAQTEEHPEPLDLEPKCPHWELPAGLMHSLIRLCDFDYEPIDGTKLRLLAPKPPTERLLTAIDNFYLPPSHDRTRDGEGWERLGLYEFYTKKEKAQEFMEKRKNAAAAQNENDQNATPGGGSNHRRRRHSGGSAAESASGDESQLESVTELDCEHMRPFQRDESRGVSARSTAHHLSHITAYPSAAIGQGVRTGADALSSAPPPMQCHSYPGYKAAPPQPIGGPNVGIAVPPPRQGQPPIMPGAPPGFPGPGFLQFPPPSMSQPPPSLPMPQGLIQRPPMGTGYSAGRTRFDSRRSRSGSRSDSRSRSHSRSDGSRSRSRTRSRSRSHSPTSRSRSRSGSHESNSSRSRSASTHSSRTGNGGAVPGGGNGGDANVPDKQRGSRRRRRHSRSRSRSGSPFGRFTSAPGPGGGGTSNTSVLSAARAAAMAAAASIASSLGSNAIPPPSWANPEPQAPYSVPRMPGQPFGECGGMGPFSGGYPPGPGGRGMGPPGRSRFPLGGPSASRMSEMHLLGAGPEERYPPPSHRDYQRR